MKCSPVTAREILPSDLPLLGQGLPPVYQDDEDVKEEEEKDDRRVTVYGYLEKQTHNFTCHHQRVMKMMIGNWDDGLSFTMYKTDNGSLENSHTIYQAIITSSNELRRQSWLLGTIKVHTQLLSHFLNGELEGNQELDPVGSTVRYEMMKLCTGSV